MSDLVTLEQANAVFLSRKYGVRPENIRRSYEGCCDGSSWRRDIAFLNGMEVHCTVMRTDSGLSFEHQSIAT
jgi:hypothetical protein